MKKLAIFAAAFVLTLGLAQCKKEQPATPQNTEGNKVHITVNVGNGSRAGITTPSSSGEYNFNNGDLLYVGYDNACVGTLAYNSETTKFSGSLDLTEANVSQKLHFYYLGGGAASQVGTTQQYTVDISNQTSNYPVISYGTSTKDYSTGKDSYTTVLLNQCALVKFTTNEIPVETAVSISGMKNKLTVDFNGNTLTPSSEGTGSITLHTENATSRWAILLPQTGLSNVKANAEGYDEASVSFTVSEIKENDYLTESASFTLTEAASNIIDLVNVTSNTTVGDGYTVTGTLGAEVKISIAAGATVTLNNASINANGAWTSGNYAGITCLGNATIILKDGSENTVRGFYEDYPGIYVPGNHTLTIKGGAAGTGKLTASPYDGGGTNDSYGAGIGGGYETPCGNIKIQGGDINATGGRWAAGIGSGDNANCGTITISGGTVTATGGSNAAGIGSGDGGDDGGGSCGAITISGGTVTATGGSDAAGIGSGYYGASCVAITISGGTVKATGGYQAAGIGSGKEASCGDITITNRVTQVTATKGSFAPNSIGAGADGSCGTVTIEPGANVTQN